MCLAAAGKVFCHSRESGNPFLCLAAAGTAAQFSLAPKPAVWVCGYLALPLSASLGDDGWQG
jgi:hypothetical protein